MQPNEMSTLLENSTEGIACVACLCSFKTDKGYGCWIALVSQLSVSSFIYKVERADWATGSPACMLRARWRHHDVSILQQILCHHRKYTQTIYIACPRGNYWYKSGWNLWELICQQTDSDWRSTYFNESTTWLRICKLLIDTDIIFPVKGGVCKWNRFVKQ